VPEVSVLMPVRDGLQTLPAAIASVQASELESRELVAVDDGSQDGSVELLRAQVEPRIRLIEQPAEGLVAALQVGLKACRSEFVARLDADDIMLPSRLRLQVERLRDSPELDLVGGGVRIEALDAEVGPGLRHYEAWLNSLHEPGAILRDFFVESPFAHPAVCFRAATVRALGGYRAGDFPEDYDLWLRLWEAGASFASLPEPVLRWRHRRDRLTFRDPRYRPAAFRALKQEVLLRTRLKGLAGVGIAGAGRDGKRWARELAARGLPVKLWLDLDPRKLGQRIHGAPVYAYSELPTVEDRPHILVAVGVKGARALIRAELKAQGLVELQDFSCVA